MLTMVIALTIVLLDLGKGEELVFVVAGQVLNGRLWRNELDLIRLSDDLAHVLSLEVLLADVAGLVVEETVRVAHPSHAAEENSTTHKHMVNRCISRSAEQCLQASMVDQNHHREQ